jgi:hypothetical protein
MSTTRKVALAVVAAAVAFAAFVGFKHLRFASQSQLPDDASEQPWYPTMGKSFVQQWSGRAGGEAIDSCVVRPDDEPFATCPSCLVICRQYGDSAGDFVLPSGEFHLEGAVPLSDHNRLPDANRSPGPDVAIEMSDTALLVNHHRLRSPGPDFDLDEFADMLDFSGVEEPESPDAEAPSASVVATAEAPAAGLVAAMERAARQGVQVFELGVVDHRVGLELRCELSEDRRQFHLFGTDWLARPYEAEDQLRVRGDLLSWHCRLPSAEPTVGEEATLHLTSHRWVQVTLLTGTPTEPVLELEDEDDLERLEPLLEGLDSSEQMPVLVHPVGEVSYALLSEAVDTIDRAGHPVRLFVEPANAPRADPPHTDDVPPVTFVFGTPQVDGPRSTEEIQRFVRRQRHDLHECFAAALAKRPASESPPTASPELSFTVAANGETSDIDVGLAGLDADPASCLRTLASSWHFPESTTEQPTRVVYAFHLSPR